MPNIVCNYWYMFQLLFCFSMPGQLMMLTDEHSKGRLQHVPADVIEVIYHYRSIASEISRLAIQAVKDDDEEYYNSMAFVVAHPWVFHNQHRKIDPTLRWDGSVYKHSSKYLHIIYSMWQKEIKDRLCQIWIYLVDWYFKQYTRVSYMAATNIMLRGNGHFTILLL